MDVNLFDLLHSILKYQNFLFQILIGAKLGGSGGSAAPAVFFGLVVSY